MSRPSLLREVLERARRAGRRGIVVFDLDSTLMDNRPRKARIAREFGVARSIEPLARARAEHWTSWSLKDAMRAMGLSDEQVAALYDDARAFWFERFFTSEYCTDDRGYPGAALFVDGVRDQGAQIAYVTGRYEGMRPGTVETLRREGFAVPGPAVHLLMKPTFEEHDDAWKLRAHEPLVELGQLVAAFDNEPTHANGYKKRFPEALVVLIQTDHSGRPVELLPGIESLAGFAEFAG